MTQLSYHTLLRCCPLLLTTLLVLSPWVRAETATTPLPAWQSLEYEQQALWVTARSQVAIGPLPGDSRYWQMTATSSVASNSEQVELKLAACNGRLLQRSRLGHGSSQRYKSHEFGEDFVVRERRTPGADHNSAPAGWPLRSRKEIPYPPMGETAVITDAYALLLLAGRFQAGSSGPLELVVNTDKNFYRVRMSHGDSGAVQVDYLLSGTGQQVTGSRDTRAVALQISPLGTLADKPDFSLLGLEDDITLLFDRKSGLPLQIRGTAPRIGNTEINLKSATMRPQELEKAAFAGSRS